MNPSPKTVYRVPEDTSLLQSQAIMSHGREFLALGAGDLTLDLSGLSVINSIALGAVVALHQQFQEKGRRVVLSHCSAEVLETLRAVGLDSLLFLEREGSILDTSGAEVDISLKIGFDVYRNVGIFTFSGSMIAAKDARLFLKMAEKILSDGFKMLIDLAGMAFIDSQGIGAMAALQKIMAKHRGEIRICSAGEIIQDLLKVHRLSELIPLYPDRDRALVGWIS